MRTYHYISLLLLVFVIVFSCKTVEDNFDRNLGYEYMGLEVGKYIIYQVDSTIFNPTGDSLKSVTNSYIKDEIIDTLRDNVGELLYKTERFIRQDTSAPWQIQKVFTQSIQANQGIVTIDNLRFIKLAFPIQVFNSWDPLVHIDQNTQAIVAGETLEPFRNGVWRSRILSADELDTIGTFQLDNVLNLREVDTSDESPFDLRISYEKYAKGIGLVYRERRILDSQKCAEECQPFDDQFDNCVNNCLAAGATDTLQCENECIEFSLLYNSCFDDCDALPWEEKAQKGYIMRMTIVDHN